MGWNLFAGLVLSIGASGQGPVEAKDACLAHGGHPSGDACAWFTDDGGQSCSDDSDCEGHCVPDQSTAVASSNAPGPGPDVLTITSSKGTVYLRFGTAVPGVCTGEHLKPDIVRSAVVRAGKLAKAAGQPASP